MVGRPSIRIYAKRTWSRVLALSGVAGFGVLLLAQVGAAETLDFESSATGETVDRIGSVSFSHGSPGVRLVATEGMGATSGRRYLGASHARGDALLAGDAVELEFDQPVTFLSIAILATDLTPTGAFELDTPAGMATSAALPPVDLGSDQVHSLALSSVEPFSTATIRSTSGVFAFHLDDLEFETVPEPANMLALGIGFLSLTTRRSLRLRAVDRRNQEKL